MAPQLLPLLLLPLSFFAGILDPSAFWSGVYVVAALGILFRWVQTDSAQRQERFSWALRAGMVVLTVFALPYYFFKSRGLWGGLKIGVQAWGIFIASMLCYRVGYSL